MSDILRDVSPAHLAAVVHEALLTHLREIAGVLPEWQLTEEGPCTLLTHRHAHMPLDGVIQARLEPATADAQIQAVRERFARDGRSIMWFTGHPGELPDLPQRLLAHGFQTDARIPGMAADLHALPGEEPLPAGVSVEPVRDDAAHGALMAVQVETLGKAFGPRALLKRAFGLSADGSVQHYLAHLDGQPVGACTAVYAGGVVSLYGIGTRAEARGRGVGRAMTLRACLDARARGYRIATLHASPLGLPVYRKLGFVEAGGMQFFVAPRPIGGRSPSNTA